MTDNYKAAQVHADGVFRIVDNSKTPNASELEAGKMDAILAVADELRAIKDLLEFVTGATGPRRSPESPGGGANRGFVRVFDEAP